MSIKNLSVLIIIMFTFALSGCAGQKDTVIKTQDRAGNNISVPSGIDRIVSMSLSNTEILTALGLGDKIIAADTNSEGLPGLKQEVLYFDMFSPDIESLISIEPDIIFASDMSVIEGEDPFKPLNDAGICVAYIATSNSIEDIISDITFIADLTGTSDNGAKLTKDMQAQIDIISAAGKTITDRKTVFFEISPMPYLYSFGKGVFLDEMLTIIGADNCLSDMQSWVGISEEAVLDMDPDVIMTVADYIEDPVGEIMNRPGWQVVSAVKNNEVYYIDANAATLPNHNIVRALKEMAIAVYPEEMSGIIE